MTKKLKLDSLQVKSFITLDGRAIKAGRAELEAYETPNTVLCCRE
ncbi:MAG: pinensin family lanthipeptide [Acidobacteriota bacterium]|nr:pinensin family lanthipeptide [Acidobacteriota bacterium]